jgi:starch synthase (maltosyl-transferring)
VVEAVAPVVDGGDFAAKAAVGRPLRIVADVFTDGHDVVAAAATFVPPTDSVGAGPAPATPITLAMTPLVNDRFEAIIVPDRLGRWTYDVTGWVSHAETWRRGTAAKIAAGIDVDVELLIGIEQLDAMLSTPTAIASTDDLAELARFRAELADGDASSVSDPAWFDVFFRAEHREPSDRFARPLPVDVDPVRASIGSWYSFFPRSTVAGQDLEDPRGPATLRDAIGRLDYIADMGFDVVYIPPVHPIGRTNRKGKDNSTIAGADDVGSPYAIGSSDGGHFSVAPELGTVDDVAALAAACRDRGMQLALDIAFNCSPDHPWVTDHPDWFTTRPDGSIQFAENPPKKYEDIYPLDFDTADWRGLWRELADVFLFWIDHGVTIFRVDNPHTKAFAFWQWAISTIRTRHPDVIFLSEAFTRPRTMQRLAKLGFNQSYTYFAWRNTAHELREYFEELATETVDYLRPNAWPNTHDILTEQLQHGGRAGFVSRAILAATLSPSWGVYGPLYELMVTAPRDGVEDYLDSEKYEVRTWDLDRPDSLAPLLTRLNEIRREQPALTDLASIRFHRCDDDGLLCFTKVDPAGQGDPVLVVVNVDPHHVRRAFVDIDLAAIGLPYGSDYDLVDQLGGATYHWSGNLNFVELRPDGVMAHIFTVHAHDTENPGATPAGQEGHH